MHETSLFLHTQRVQQEATRRWQEAQAAAAATKEEPDYSPVPVPAPVPILPDLVPGRPLTAAQQEQVQAACPKLPAKAPPGAPVAVDEEEQQQPAAEQCGRPKAQRLSTLSPASKVPAARDLSAYCW